MSNDAYGKMGELQDEDYRLPLNENLIDHDKFLDLTSLTDADDFEDCASWIQEDEEKEKVIERLIENQSGSNLFREICFSRGGLLNGRTNLFYYIVSCYNHFFPRRFKEKGVATDCSRKS